MAENAGESLLVEGEELDFVGATPDCEGPLLLVDQRELAEVVSGGQLPNDSVSVEGLVEIGLDPLLLEAFDVTVLNYVEQVAHITLSNDCVALVEPSGFETVEEG